MALSPSYASVQDLAGYLRVGDGEDDAQLGLALAAASRAIDRTCKRQFGQADAPAARIYTPRIGPDGLVVDLDDLMSRTGLVVEADLAGDGAYATPITGYRLSPVNAAALGKPWTQLSASTGFTVAQDSIRVTALWGWSTVPDTIEQACLMQASRLHARRDSPFGVAGSPDAGGEMRLLAKVDPDVAVILRDYTRRWYAV